MPSRPKEDGPAVRITLKDVPVELFRQSAAYHEELMRECSLLLVNEPDARGDVPGHLLVVAEELRLRYQPVTAPEAQVEAAEVRGERILDLEFDMPAAVADDIFRLGELLEAAEDYSSNGKLLTVSPPPEISRFRRWYVREIAGQISGSAPRPWDGG